MFWMGLVCSTCALSHFSKWGGSLARLGREVQAEFYFVLRLNSPKHWVRGAAGCRRLCEDKVRGFPPGL